MVRNLYYDVVIAGCGVAGLYTALSLPEDQKILMLSKEGIENCDSMLAQGGICVMRDEEDYEPYFEDTMKAGHYENRKESVEIMIRSSRGVIDHLLKLGVRFDMNPDGSLNYTREGAHSRPRICFHKDITGKEITTVLQKRVRELPNVTVMEFTAMTDILVSGGACTGMIAKTEKGEILHIHTRDTVMATGGIGGLYEHSTNFPCLTGDALAIAKKYGVELENMDYVQIHPTSLYSEKPGRSFLISESARGEGAVLLNGRGERFVDELLPRDVVTKAIHAEMEREGSGMYGSHSSRWVKLRFGTISRIFTEGVWKKATTSQKNRYRLSRPSTILWGGFMWTVIQEPRWTTFTQWGRPAVTVSMERTAWPATVCWRVLYLHKGPQPVWQRAGKGVSNMNPITMQLAADKYIRLALEEDINSEDVTTNSVMPEYKKGEVQLICKEDGIIAGLPIFERVFLLLDPRTKVTFDVKDGDRVEKGRHLATVTGDIRVLLSGERTALNYLQRMSGIATYTNTVVKLLEGTRTKLLDTRKTTPCMRIFEKYAVRVGGGNNHRYNLSDGILLKDNHIDAAGGVKEAIAAAKAYAPFVRRIEVETENLSMVREAVEAGADIIMLDNMTPGQMAEAVKLIDGRAETECSGNITRENIRAITETGVDYVSSGALTHSAPILDISLKHLRAVE